MANKKIQATAKLFLDTKDAQSDAAKFVNNLKQKLLDIETAADKFTAFKDMVDYLAQVDKALGSLKSKNADVFTHMFDGLDENLRKQLEDVFGVTKEQLTILDQLKNKVATVKQSGTTTGSDLKPLEQEVRSLYEAAGMLDKLDLSGKGKVETRIKKIETALEEFAVVFSGVNNKLSKGFGFDGQSLENIGENIVNSIKGSAQEVETSFDDLKKLIKKKVSEVFDAQVDGADAKKLDSIKKSLYDALSLSPNDDSFYNIEDIFDELADSGDEDKAVKAITSIAERIKNAKQELNNALHEEVKSPSDASGKAAQLNVGDNIRKKTDKTVDAIEYSKKKIVEAWKDYYNAAMDAEKQGVKIEGGIESTYEMDSTKASIEKMLDKWNVGGKAKFDILSLDEYIVDKDIRFDDIEKEIDKIFGQHNIKPDIAMEALSSEITDVKNDMSTLGDVSQQSASDISSGMEDAQRKTLAVGDAFAELVKYISQSGQSPNTFFQNLESGAQSLNDDLKNILASLNLLNSNGNANFSSLKSGFSNTGGMISDNYVLISRDESKLPFSLETKQKSLDAKSMGANIGAVLEVYEDKANGIIYELQNKVEGKAILDFEKGIINTEFLDATDEQIKKLISDLEILKSTGLYVDWNGSNVLYDKDKGFSFIDFFSNSVEPYTVGAKNSVQENLQTFFDKIFHNFNLNTSDSLDVMAFKTHVENLIPNVTKQTAAQEDMVEASQEVKNATDATISSLTKEETSHEQNTAAINEENKALQAQIELKKKAQSMTWKEFAIDDSLTDMKGASGLQTLSDAEKFWKQANYDKKVDFYELSESATNDIINQNMDYSLRADWYGGEEFAAKTEIENVILANDKLRNAAMNKLYQIYKQYVDSAIKFDEFLNSEFTVYRGDDAPVIYGDEQQLSFSFRKHKAEDFDANHVQSTKIIPKNTIGSVVTPTYEPEVEVFVPSSKLPYVSDTYQSFEEYYESLADTKKKTLDAALVQLEAQRVKSLLDDDLISNLDKASSNKKFTDKVLNKFNQGIVPQLLDPIEDFDAGDDFVVAYNTSLSDMQKKMIAYYTSLKSQAEYMGKIWSSDHKGLGKTDLINTVVNDKEGIKKHVAGLTSESKFKLFGDATQDIGTEVELHKKNTQVISAEQQAQEALNNSKQAFLEVQHKLAAATLAADGGKDSELNSIWSSVAQVYQTEQKQLSGGFSSDILSDGYYQSPSTGELLAVEDLLNTINDFEKTYGDNLDYVKDYLSQVFARYETQVIDDFVDASSPNAVPTDFNGIKQKLASDVVDLMSGHNWKQHDELQNIMYSVVGANKTAQSDLDMIDKGEFVHQATGEIINVTDFLETIGEYETKYGENLQYVKDYVNKVFENYNSQIDSFLSGARTSSGDDGADFEDELILDGFDITDDDVYDHKDKNKFSEPDVAAAEQQLAVEQQITSEKKQQVQLEDAEQQAGVGSSNVEGEIDALNNLLLKINSVEQAVKDKTQAFIDEGTVVDQIVGQEVGSLNRLLEILEQITSHINNILEGLQQINNTKLNNGDEDNVTDTPIDTTVDQTTNPSQTGYALNTTVLETNRILNEISGKITSNEPFADVAESLNNAITELKNVASGIVEHQKAQQTDKSTASAKIANNYGQLTDISSNMVSTLGNEVQIKQMKALADGVVRVEGAVRNVDGIWKGFIVDIDEANNAVLRAVDEHSAFAKILNEEAEAVQKAEEKSKEAGQQDKFAQSLSAQKSAFNEYKKSLEDVDYLNNEIKNGFDELSLRLNAISDADGLDEWKDDFSALKDEISVAQEVFEKIELDKIKQIRGQLNSEFKNLDFTTTTSDPTDEQREILDLRKQLIAQLEEYKLGVKNGKEVELDAINQIMAALRQKVSVYREENDLASGGKQKFGATAVLNATAKYNSLSQQASSGEFVNSSVVQQALQQYEAAYNSLIAKRKELAKVEGSLTDTQKAEFKELQNECNNYSKILSKIITDSQKLQSNGVAHSLLGDDFEDSASGRQAALMEFVESLDVAGVQTGEFKDNFNQLVYVVDNGDGTFTEMTATINAARTAIDATAGTTKEAIGVFESFFNELKGKFKSIGAYMIATVSIHDVIRVVKQGVQYVKEIDLALTELKKVTDETEQTYAKFLDTASQTASKIGSTVADFTNATADFARLGYSIEQATELAKAASVYKNVGDGINDISTASESIISTMKAFGIEANNAMGIVDRFNEIGNNFAISSTGIGEAMLRSASALYAAGNTIDESIALITGANSVVQNPEQVGTALKTLSLRLRGAKVELEEAGLETENMAESTAKLQSDLKALTHGKVDIMLDADTFKSTTEILREMSQAWEDMTDIERAAALELMGGKRQANILSSLITNFETVEDVIKTSANSAGSALAENEKYLDSIQGRIDLFNNAVQTLWMNLLDSGVIKGVVDIGTTLIKLLDTIYGKIIAIVGAFAVYKKFKDGVKFADMFKGSVDVLKNTYSAIMSMISGTKSLTVATLSQSIATKINNKELAREILIDSGLSAATGALTEDHIKNTAATLSEAFANGKLSASQYLTAMSTMGLKTALQGLWTVLKSNPIILAAAAIAGLALAFDHFHTTAQEAAEAAKKAFEEIQSVVDSTKSTIQELESELSTLNDKIDELTGKEASFANDKELEKLKKQREELEHSLKVQEQLLELQQGASNKQAVATMKAYTKAASEGAEETQETAKTWGTISGVLAGIGAALGILLAVPTGGTSLAATLGLSGTAVAGTAAISGAAVGIAGNKLGEAAGSGMAANEGTYDSWYETYTKALETARKEEQKALKKYQKDSSDIDKLNKWQEMQQKTSEIETEMYEHLSQMQQYFSGLEYGVSDEIDKELDTWNNFLDKMSIDQGASGAEVTALDRIFGENASEEIQLLKDQILDAVQSGKEFDFNSAINDSQELGQTLAYVGLTAEDVKNYFTQIGEAAGDASGKSVIPVTSYSELLTTLETFNDIQKQTEEIIIDNTRVTQDYKDALVGLVGSEEKVNEYFDDNNRLIVKDAKGLNNLVKSTKKNAAASAALAKSQARLQYYELYQEIKQLVGGQAVSNTERLKEIISLYQEMNALEKTIARYSVLEEQLLGAANAYEKFAKAQEIDAQTDYISSAEDMVLALGQAFNTAELGTEAAQTAIAGLVPESVYEDLDTVDEKMAAIHKYFKEGKIAQYFDLEFNDDGAIESAEMKLGNLRKFIEDGLTEGVFTGTDWMHFDLSEDITSLDELAKQMGVTKEVAFAFLETLEDHDIEWLNGDYTSLLEKLLPPSLENDIYKNTSALADLEIQLANGEITAEEYATTLGKLTSEEAALADRAREETSVWYDKTEQLEKYKTQLQEYQKQLETGMDSDGNVIDSEKVQQNISEVKSHIDTLSVELRELEEPTELTLQLALDDIQEELDTLEKEFEEQGIDIKAHLKWDTENSEWTVDENSELKGDKKVQQYVELSNDQSNLETLADDGIVTVDEHLSNITEILESIRELQDEDSQDIKEDSSKQDDKRMKEDSSNNPVSKIDVAKEVASEKMDDFKTKAQELFNTTLPNAWDEFWASIDSFFDGIGEQASELKEKLSKFFGETVPEKWNEFWDGVSEFFAPLVEQANILKEKVTLFFTETVPEKWGQFWVKAAEIWENVQAWADATKDKVVNFFTVTIPEKWGQFWDKAGEVWDGVQEWASTTKDKVVDFFTVTLPDKWSAFWDKVDTFLTESVPYAISYAAGAVTRFFTEVIPQKWDEFWDGVEEAWDNTKEWGNMVKDKAVEFFTKTIPDAWDSFWDGVDGFIDESLMPALASCANSVKLFFTETIPQKWDEFWVAAGEAWDNITDWATATKDDVVAFFTETIPNAWSSFWGSVGTYIDENITPALQSFANTIKSFFTETIPTKWNEFWGSVSGFISGTIIPALQIAKNKVVEFFTVTIPAKWNAFWSSVGTFLSTSVPQALAKVKTGVTTFFTVTVPSAINSMWSSIASWISSKVSSIWANLKAGFTAGKEGGKSGTAGVNGTAHVKGTVHKGKAYKTGDFGLPKSEHDALVGEIAPEMVVDPNTGRYYTVGDNGAEMVDLPKGAIIFNHKQTEGLLKNGHIASRGKAYAEGNAHLTIYPNASSKDQWEGTGYSSWNDPTYDAAGALNDAAKSLSDAADKTSDAADEFHEVFDWIEVRLEEINEELDFKSAQLENAVGVGNQNSIIDEMLGINNVKLNNLQAGLKEYANYAAKLLAKVPAKYRDAAQDGAIAIEEFAGEADEKTLEAINNYREWAQKVADLKQQLQEVKTEISDLAKQQFDNMATHYDNKIGIYDKNIEQYEGLNDTVDAMGLPGSVDFYKQLISYSKKRQDALIEEQSNLQYILDEQVKLGNIKVKSDRWYEMVNAIYDVDIAIQECAVDMEDYQNAINDIYWDNFDELISRLEGVSDEAQNLIDLMDSADMVITPETSDGWSADQVEWTKEGIASLGLYAQKMETAEYTSKQYEKAIKDLNKNYKKGLYSESEYIEKLNELKSAQYDSIEAYYDAQDAIVELNKARVESIKKGIEKEIKAYEKLIETKKEELSAEKDLYDFQKSTMDQQKNIANIERQLAALANDNSLSAVAKRKQLEAELAEAQYELQDTYYNRSVEDKQTALDKELETFQTEKEAELTKWEEYLEKVEVVVTDSLLLVQQNATGIYDTLNEKADEYGLNLSTTLLTPWQDGALAIDEYQEKFGNSMSSTMDELAKLKQAWQDVIDLVKEESKLTISSVKESNKRITSAKEETKKTSSTTNNNNKNKTTTTAKAIKVGGKINAGSALIYGHAGDKTGERQYFRNDPVYVVLDEKNGYLKVRHHKLSSGVTGWFKKADVKAYAKGTKGVDKDQVALIDELGEELVLHAGPNGKLQYLTKGSGVIPADITANLMKLGELNTQEMLDRNRPQIAPNKNIVNTEINLDCSVGELVHIEHCDRDTLPDVEKLVDKAFNKHMQNLNNNLKRYSR